MGNAEKDEGQVINDTLQQNGSEGSPELTGKTINISGKSFNVSDDIAQAYSDLTKDIDRRFQERSEELGSLRQFKNDALRREQELQAVSHKQSQPDLSTLMYEDPNKFVDALEGKIQEAANKLRTEYQQEKATEKEEAVFWNSIWTENKDLAMIKSQATDVIKMVGNKYAHLNLPNTKQVRDAITKEAREWMKGIIGNSVHSSSDAFVEGSSTVPTPQAKKKAEEKPRKTTKEILEERRERKRKAVAERI
jgi:hypothetical protein